MNSEKKSKIILRVLNKTYPKVPVPLSYKNTFTLLISVLLSAQCTDVNVNNVTKNIPNLPKLGVVRNIDASKWDAGKAYLTIEFHQIGNFEPYVYKTENFGKSWKKITEGIKSGNISYTRCIKEDPVKEGLLYLGTENALYVSNDDGENWQSLMSNLPHSPMYWMEVQEHFNDLVVGTYGRGIWILDDISPLQQIDETIEKKEY